MRIVGLLATAQTDEQSQNLVITAEESEIIPPAPECEKPVAKRRSKNASDSESRTV